MAVARDDLRADPTGSCAVSGTPELVPLTARGLAVRPLYQVGGSPAAGEVGLRGHSLPCSVLLSLGAFLWRRGRCDCGQHPWGSFPCQGNLGRAPTASALAPCLYLLIEGTEAKVNEDGTSMQAVRFCFGNMKGGKVLSWSAPGPSRRRGLREEELNPARGPGEGSRKKWDASCHSKDRESSG